MSVTTPVSPLPYPPDEYNQQYYNELIRTLNLFFRQVQNPGPVITSGITLINLPTSAAGLAPGTVWVDTGAGNALKMA